jgi:hypothetical protein
MDAADFGRGRRRGGRGAPKDHKLRCLKLEGMDDVEAAHQHCSNHRSEITTGTRCGCFYCCAVFHPDEIKEWVDYGETALCPRCGIDSVIGDRSGYPVQNQFLERMRTRWF